MLLENRFRIACGRKFIDAHDCRERVVRDLPWSEFRTAVYIEVYRVKCPDCGVKVEKVPLLPSKAPFSKRFEDAVGQACESASARQVARRFGLAWPRVRYGRSICGTWSDGPPRGASRRSGRWVSMRFTGGRATSF
jgi:transposase